MEQIYNRVLFRAVLNNDNLDGSNYYRNIAVKSKEFVLAIPDQWIYARIMGTAYGYDPDKMKVHWMEYDWIDDVVIFDTEHVRLKYLRELYQFDTYFAGVEYGQAYLEDMSFCRRNGIKMILIAPDRYVAAGCRNALEIALQDVPCTKKIICYGAGDYFDIYMKVYGEKYKPVYAVDRNKKLWNTEKNGIEIYAPEKLYAESMDDVLVVLCSKEYGPMREDLEIQGKFNYRTLLFSNDLALIDEFGLAIEKEKMYIKEASIILRRLMHEFDRICKKYDLKYYMISGSLIGVVRHHGMIPWDDDIDVGMPREDFEKLKKVVGNEWDGKEYLFVDYWELGNNVFHDLMPRIYYMKEKFPTRIMDKSRGKMGRDLADRIVLDIYPLDHASDYPIKHYFNMLSVKLIYNLMMGHRGYIDYKEYTKLPEKTIKIIKLINDIGRLVPFQILVKWMNRAVKIENRHETKKYYMSSGPIYYVERTYDKKFFGKGKLMDFEDMQVWVPVDYDGLLKAQNYGNYMEFPAYERRRPSHYFNVDISIW